MLGAAWRGAWSGPNPGSWFTSVPASHSRNRDVEELDPEGVAAAHSLAAPACERFAHLGAPAVVLDQGEPTDRNVAVAEHAPVRRHEGDAQPDGASPLVRGFRPIATGPRQVARQRARGALEGLLVPLQQPSALLAGHQHGHGGQRSQRHERACDEEARAQREAQGRQRSPGRGPGTSL